MKILRTMMMLALVVIIGVGMATSADAAFKLYLVDIGTGNDIEITDNDGNDISGLSGVIVYNSALGDWSVTVTTGLSKPALPNTASRACMDLNSVVLNSVAPAEIVMYLTDNDFMLSQSNPKLKVTSSIGGTVAAGGTLEAAKWHDPNNAEYGGNLLYTLGPFGPGAFSQTKTALVDNSPAFSMTEGVYIAHTIANTSSSFDYQNCVTTVPEPGTLMLLGSGLLGIAGYSRFKFGKKKKSA